MKVRRVAALAVLVVTACSFGSTPRVTPSKSSIVSWLRDLDSNGVDFSITTRIAGGPIPELSAAGHERRGEIDMTTGSVRLVVFDGVLYGLRAGSSKWLEMGVDQVNFLWPAARLSLVWEAIQLSTNSASPFQLGRDQLLELAGALKAGQGQVLVPRAFGRIEVTLDGSRSVFKPGQPDAADVEPPSSATPGNVVSLLAPGISA